jgi:prepilin-type N-terminal cleavage/methylation domain-containing protein/prepilin-type processing-associated H-X9-DG protein
MVSGHRTSKRFACGSAFTLIELLTVVAVIAVLLAILLPCLHRTRIAAKKTRCSANLRQIALAWDMYLDDSDGRFYQGVNANLDYGGWRGYREWWPRPLNRYASLSASVVNERDARLFCCPADQGGTPGPYLRTRVYLNMGTSYQTNIFLVGQTACGPFSERTAELDEAISARLAVVKRQDVSGPSRLLLIGDYGWINQWMPAPHKREEYKTLAEWHQREDHHNMAFLDGHVGFLEIRKGYYLTDEYAVLPFSELYSMAMELQGPDL